MSALWNGLLDILGGILEFFHAVTAPLFGPENAWGWAIILLTVTVRLFLLPLAIKQIRSQRAMQRLQPELKKIQAKYKADRGLMRSNPDKYKELRAKQQEAMMGLYKEHGVNPAAGCAPLLAQMPIFFALFSVLRSARVPSDASFYLLSDLTQTVREAGPAAYALVLLMGLTTYLSSKQMMASTPTAGEAQAQQQKIMLYAMPVILVVFSLNFFIGVLLYWTTTNLWTIGQQYLMFRNASADAGGGSAKPAPPAPPAKPQTPESPNGQAKTPPKATKRSKADKARRKPA